MKYKALLSLVIAFTLSSCLPANIIITGKTRPRISTDSVKFYNPQTLPDVYEIIGRINTQSESTLDRKWAHDQNMYKLQEKAASVGANGLLIEDTQNSYDAWGSSYMSINATAIYIDPKNINSKKSENNRNENSKSKFDNLKKLKEILDEGIITKEEYEKEKKKILDE